MSMQDTVSDFITRVNNAHVAGLDTVNVINSKFILSLVNKLTKLKFFESYKELDREIQITIGKNFKRLRSVSRPSQPVYTKSKGYLSIKDGYGYNLVSTSSGIKTHVECLKENTGGKVILQAIR